MGVGSVYPNYSPMTWEKYDIVPHYKWFRFIWYDLVHEKWQTDGSHVPMSEVTVLRSKVRKKEVKTFLKLLKND